MSKSKRRQIKKNNNNGCHILFFFACHRLGMFLAIAGCVSSKGETGIPARLAGAGLACRPWKRERERESEKRDDAATAGAETVKCMSRLIFFFL